MKRDELVKYLLTLDNVEVVINADGVLYEISEKDIFQCANAIIIQPD